MSKNTLNTII